LYVLSMRYQKQPDNTPQNDSIAINRKLSEQGAKWLGGVSDKIESIKRQPSYPPQITSQHPRDKLDPTIKAHLGI